MSAEEMFEQPSWEEMYGAKTRVWSGEPNPVLVTEVSALPPGTALDVGSGEGGDAIWLARHGWRVTGVDFSTVALARAAEHAGDLPIEWLHADVRTWTPPRPYDLVSSHFMHLPPEPRRALFARLAAAVAPRGTLLVVGHDGTDHPIVHKHGPEMFFTAEEVAAGLDPAEWAVDVAESRKRPAKGHEGEAITVGDVVVRAHRVR